MNICKREYEAFYQLCTGNQKAYFKWILENGREFKGRNLTKEEIAFLKTKCSGKIFTFGKCTILSQTAVTSDQKLRYFEGTATTKDLGIPLDHAWLVLDDQILDPTWREGADYFGVEVPTDFIRKNILETGHAEMLLGKYYALEVKENE